MVRRKGNKFFQDIEVPCYDVDARFRMKPASFMDFAQELGNSAADGIGFGFDYLQKNGVAWVLSRMHFHFDKAPRWRDALTLSSWSKGPDGLFFLRDFRLEGPEGESYVRCTSSWLLVDTVAHRLFRDPIGAGILATGGEDSDDAIEERAPKITMPKGVEPEEAGTVVSSYSDIDFLGHTNNARYAVWSMDAIPYEDASSLAVTDFYINFNHEVRPGERVILRRVRTATPDGGADFCVEGLLEGHNCFTARIILAASE